MRVIVGAGAAMVADRPEAADARRGMAMIRRLRPSVSFAGHGAAFTKSMCGWCQFICGTAPTGGLD